MRQVVRCFLKNAQNKYLLVQHHKSDTWTLPGGHIEEGESLYKALKREIKEEFDLKITIKWDCEDLEMEPIKVFPLPLSVYRINYESKKYGPQKKMEYIFEAEVEDITFLKADIKEIKEYQWFTKEEILELQNVFLQIQKLIVKI
jgi:8-oxo-dGTP diphosphatase